MVKGSGGGGRSGRSGGGGSSETIAEIETPWGTRYQVKDAAGNVIDFTKAGYSDKFATKDKAEKALAEYKAKQTASAESERKFMEERAAREALLARTPFVSSAFKQQKAAPPAPRSEKATDKQFKYAKDLARTTGNQRVLDNLNRKRAEGTLTKSGISKTIERLKLKKNWMKNQDMLEFE